MGGRGGGQAVQRGERSSSSEGEVRVGRHAPRETAAAAMGTDVTEGEQGAIEEHDDAEELRRASDRNSRGSAPLSGQQPTRGRSSSEGWPTAPGRGRRRQCSRRRSTKSERGVRVPEQDTRRGWRGRHLLNVRQPDHRTQGAVSCGGRRGRRERARLLLVRRAVAAIVDRRRPSAEQAG